MTLIQESILQNQGHVTIPLPKIVVTKLIILPKIAFTS